MRYVEPNQNGIGAQFNVDFPQIQSAANDSQGVLGQSTKRKPRNMGSKMDTVNLPPSENSYEFIQKNFPFLQPGEITNLLKEEDQDKKLTELYHKREVRPYFEAETQKFKQSIFGAKAPIK